MLQNFSHIPAVEDECMICRKWWTH